MNRYIVKWNGKLQPINGITFEVAKQYIVNCVNSGTPLSQFELSDKYGILKTNIVNIPNVIPNELSNYIKRF